MIENFLIIVYLTILTCFAAIAFLENSSFSRWRLKLGIVIFALIAATGYYFHIDTLRGYPTNVVLDEASIAAIEVNRPSETDSGGIYLWVYEKHKERGFLDMMYGVNSDKFAPRSYMLPYSKENERKYSALKSALMEGNIVRTERTGNANAVTVRIIDPRKIIQKNE